MFNTGNDQTPLELNDKGAENHHLQDLMGDFKRV